MNGRILRPHRQARRSSNISHVRRVIRGRRCWSTYPALHPLASGTTPTRGRAGKERWWAESRARPSSFASLLQAPTCTPWRPPLLLRSTPPFARLAISPSPLAAPCVPLPLPYLSAGLTSVPCPRSPLVVSKRPPRSQLEADPGSRRAPPRSWRRPRRGPILGYRPSSMSISGAGATRSTSALACLTNPICSRGTRYRIYVILLS